MTSLRLGAHHLNERCVEHLLDLLRQDLGVAGLRGARASVPVIRPVAPIALAATCHDTNLP